MSSAQFSPPNSIRCELFVCLFGFCFFLGGGRFYLYSVPYPTTTTTTYGRLQKFSWRNVILVLRYWIWHCLSSTGYIVHHVTFSSQFQIHIFSVKIIRFGYCSILGFLKWFCSRIAIARWDIWSFWVPKCPKNWFWAFFEPSLKEKIKLFLDT